MGGTDRKKRGQDGERKRKREERRERGQEWGNHGRKRERGGDGKE